MTHKPSLGEEDLRKLQNLLMEMLLEVDRICRKNNIQYFIIGGTLLGAIRHKGFIPWDDDIDVGMMRLEYEKYKKACEKDLNTDKYFLQDNETDPHYRWGYSRLRRKNSEFTRIGQEHMKMKTGIFLDIFIADNVPDLYPLRLLHALGCFICRKILYSESGKIAEESFLMRAIYSVFSYIPVKYVFYVLKKLRGKNLTDWVRVLTFPTPAGGTFAFPRRWYEDFSDVEFEGHGFPAIKNYHEYLTYKYDDYTVLPPEEKRHWHPAAVLEFPKD